MQQRRIRHNLSAKAWFALAVLAIVMGALLFVPAGTVDYWQAWVYLATFNSASALTTLYLMRNDRALLVRRMKGGPAAEERPVQKFIMLCTSIGFIAILVVPALDHRFGWSSVPIMASHLPGYAEYRKRVHHRLVPFVW